MIYSKERNDRVSKGLKKAYTEGRRIQWTKGKHLTEEHKNRISNSNKGKKKITENGKKILSDIMLNGGSVKARLGSKLKISKPELVLLEIIKKNNLNFEYVGDAKFFVQNLNPDFIDKENKIIIEVYGNYWHSKPRYLTEDKERIKRLNDNGYKVMIIWESELTGKSINGRVNKLNEKEILNKIKEFRSI